VFYNGVTLEDIHGGGFEKGVTTKDGGTTRNGIQGSCTLFRACLIRENLEIEGYEKERWESEEKEES